MSIQICRGKGFTTDAKKIGVCSMNANPGDFAEELKTSGTHFETLMEYSNVVANRLPQRQAFYTIDLADILWKVQEWKRCLPNVELFYGLAKNENKYLVIGDCSYNIDLENTGQSFTIRNLAVKANADPVLLKLLVLLGLSFDCATEGEIERMFKAGASPDDIIFAHTIKAENGLQFARDKGVHLMTFDNEEEILKIHRLHPTARLLLRLTPTKVECSFDLSRFGCSEEEYVELLLLAKQLGLNVVGIAFHVGSLCTDPSSYTSIIQKCRHVFDKARDMGYTFSILDIGGGFFGQIGTEELFYKMFHHIQQALYEHFPSGEVRVIAEPGCYLVSSASRLVCTIIGKRNLKNTRDGQPSRHYFINDGIFGSFFVNIDHYGLLLKPMLLESEARARPEYNSDIFGQTCYSYDVIRRNTPLVDMRVGERIVWQNMGAYASSGCSTFNGTPIPQTRHVFVKNERLNVDWINKAAKHFIKENVVFIGSKDTETSL